MAEFTFSDTTGVINLSSARENLVAFTGHFVVGLYPASSNTCLVEITLAADPTSVGAVWHPWDDGAVTTNTISGLYAFPTGIRATRTAGTNSGNKLIVVPL